ncbi:hypothetical protein [Streptomyces griseocarneus]|uniref:hypothetical protein n=1 Tax=Streptomyces griseocarneus TaxID=51201 RepID=UPI00167E5C4F|nr:hypothetical protein [Streptomyces griseocarneus]MBZ6475448.1 hypothetical protein [Streptomyces griseocarneus]
MTLLSSVAPLRDPSAVRDTLVLYSNFSAILAGFAFTAVIVVISLTRERASGSGGDDLGETLTVGISSFFALSVTAVSYGSVVAASDDVYRTLLGSLLSGTSLAFSSLLLTLFIVLLLDSLVPGGSAAKYTRRVLTQFLPLLCFADLQGPLEAYLSAKFQDGAPISTRIVSGCFLVVLLAWSVGGFFIHRWGFFVTRFSIPRSGARWMALGILCSCAAATTSAALYVNFTSQGAVVDVGFMMAITTLGFLGFLSFAVCTSLLEPA